MKRSLAFVISILFLFSGLLIENQFDLFPAGSDSNEQSEESNKRPAWTKEFAIVEIPSPIDGELQKAYFYPTRASSPQPLVVSLHTWSSDYTQYDSINQFCVEKDFNYIHPDFRGINNHRDACCSNLVISDIDAAIDFALENANIDPDRIFVIGNSGGGYAAIAMFMKSKHRIRKFSSWVPLVDLVRWYDETKIRKLKYAGEILACTESGDGSLNTEIALQKSPIYWQTPAAKLQDSRLEIFTGVYDGMTGGGPIPITHSINFYNKVLHDLGETEPDRYISDAEKLNLLEFREPLGDFGFIGSRRVYLVKESNNIRLTIFEGGHEMLRRFAFEDLLR